MSEEISAPRSVPPVVEHPTAPERDLSDLRREVIESRNLVIKTDNLLKNLHAELKQMGRKQELFEKRHMMSSVAAYILFAALAAVGAFTFARSEIRGAREESAANEGRVKQLAQEVETLRRGEGSRRDASEKAMRVYELLGTEKEGPGLSAAMQQSVHLDRGQLSALEARAIDDRSAGMKVRIAEAASEIDAAWLQLTRNIDELYQLACAGEKLPFSSRLRVRRDQVRGTERAISAIDRLFENSGGRALKMGTPIQRFWRDAHSGRVHAANDAERAYVMFGTGEFGLPVENAMV